MKRTGNWQVTASLLWARSFQHAQSELLFVRAFTNFPAIGGQHFIQGRNALNVQLTPPPETAGSQAISADFTIQPTRSINISASISNYPVSTKMPRNLRCICSTTERLLTASPATWNKHDPGWATVQVDDRRLFRRTLFREQLVLILGPCQHLVARLSYENDVFFSDASDARFENPRLHCNDHPFLEDPLLHLSWVAD